MGSREGMGLQECIGSLQMPVKYSAINFSMVFKNEILAVLFLKVRIIIAHLSIH